MCSYQKHADKILDIFNDEILNSTALYEYKPRTPESMVSWFRAKQEGNFPVIGLEDEGGELLGFGSYGTFREWPAYKYSVEHSVYVRKDQREKGFGLLIMNNMIENARSQGYHVLIGGIDESNMASIYMHTKLGFVHAGTIKHAAFKFGRWLNLSFYQLILDTPENPVDG
ncbi:phosphinothricin acetyltransferase [Nitrosospira sp. Nsp5]|uniref:Phosphinothricin acetyltransferase n=1 Tax=Nitrosospira multiformis TaxID=1231 RepID=A0ABY0TF41_9PROT|nr:MULTISPECIES: GNAT family N-acetyltransferase [Nitrosospira]PTR10859.1 phosphinothricin acetyltransferase [Nitrosospira sp. Nsp5]SDQ73341.1 phosphinothricin acetyltransferase [Nitrosospira multiformis]